ncbi:MAG TPA: FAD-dependent thymidylate synthase [Anaerolineaceae bacterium]|nr:FAD-dependent thymidylate synthase [Anaerolineaceae bacterium]HOH92517.1 FAD-dependent thymidylate synthase [Anaerolineaceae bacterium]HQN68805.1 FAD-dependent thymidylate synthase [Anaerolineaceae bacterium]
MDLNRRVYRLSPRDFGAETIAVAFAKTSRSPEPFDVIANELNDDKSREFSEKWIVGYGHSSVAEHAVLHLALENVSRLAIETVEANRLASYTEKSTRYQEWDPNAFVVPPEVIGTEYEKPYRDYMRANFDFYAKALEALRPWGEANTPRRENESNRAWANRARVKAVDVARFVLPMAAMANVGVTMNARTLEYAIKKMLSSELAEVREIGAEIKRVSNEELPTLVKYADEIEHLPAMRERCRAFAEQIDAVPDDEWCHIHQFENNGEERILAAVLYRFGDASYDVCFDQVIKMSLEERQAIVDALFEGMNPFDVPIREIEYANLSFDLVMDQGAYFEFKRHRMMTQTPQDLSTRLGYSVPLAITEAGIEDEYRAIMKQASDVYELIAAWNPQVAAYVVPNAYNRRVLCQTNLRALSHFISLRTAGNAHFSIRRVARAMLEKASEIYPLICSTIRLKNNETSEGLTKEYFTAVADKA